MTQTFTPGRCPIAHSMLDHEVQQLPYEYYTQMQAHDPVHYDDKAGLYLVSKHDLVIKVARDYETFSSALDMRRDMVGMDAAAVDALYAEQGYIVKDVLTQVDPPKHSVYRAMVERLFTGPIANRMEGDIQGHVDGLIDSFIDNGEVDILNALAVPLPLIIIADQLGVPRADMADFKRWTDAIIETLGVVLSPERNLECAKQIIEFQHYFAAKLNEKKHAPATDIISYLASVKDAESGRDLTIEERLALVQQLLVAGNETTRNHLAKCILLLIQNPDQQALLRQNPSLIGNFVEESLRLESPVQGMFRRATKDVTLAGVDIPKGATLVLLFGAANRDPEVFEDPDQLMVDRKNAHRHLAFSHGIHSCIGAMLARKELAVALSTVLRRMTDLAIKDGHPAITHLPNLILRGLDGGLTITFRKA